MPQKFIICEQEASDPYSGDLGLYSQEPKKTKTNSNIPIEKQREIEKKAFTKSTRQLASDRERKEERARFIELLKQGSLNNLSDEQKQNLAFKYGLASTKDLNAKDIFDKKLKKGSLVDDLFSKNVPDEIKNTEEYKIIKELSKYDKIFKKEKFASLINDCAQTSNIPIYVNKTYKTKSVGQDVEFNAQKGEIIWGNVFKLLKECYKNKLREYITERTNLLIKNFGKSVLKRMPVLGWYFKRYRPEIVTKSFQTAAKFDKYPYPPMRVTLPFKDESGVVTPREYLAPPGEDIRVMSRNGKPLMFNGKPVFSYERDVNGNPMVMGSPPLENIEYKNPEDEKLQFFVPNKAGIKLRDISQKQYIDQERLGRITQYDNKIGKGLSFASKDSYILSLTIIEGVTKQREYEKSLGVERVVIEVKKTERGEFLILNPKNGDEISMLRFVNESRLIQEGVRYKIEVSDYSKVVRVYPEFKIFKVIQQSQEHMYNAMYSEVLNIEIVKIDIKQKINTETFRGVIDNKIAQMEYDRGNVEDLIQDLKRAYFSQRQNDFSSETVGVVEHYVNRMASLCEEIDAVLVEQKKYEMLNPDRVFKIAFNDNSQRLNLIKDYLVNYLTVDKKIKIDDSVIRQAILNVFNNAQYGVEDFVDSMASMVGISEQEENGPRKFNKSRDLSVLFEEKIKEILNSTKFKEITQKDDRYDVNKMTTLFAGLIRMIMKETLKLGTRLEYERGKNKRTF